MKGASFLDNIRRAIVIVTALVLIGAGVVGFMFALDNIKTGTGSGEQTTVYLKGGEPIDLSDTSKENQTVVEPSDISTTLFVLTDNTLENAELIFTATVDYTSKKIDLIFYPADMSIALKLDSETTVFGSLADFYENRGLDVLSEAVGGIFSSSIKAAVAFTENTLSKELIFKFTSVSDGVEYYCPRKIDALSESGTYVSIPKGKSFLSYDKAIKLLTFYKTNDDTYGKDIAGFYDGTRLPQNKIASTFAYSFITQCLIGDDSGSSYIDSYKSIFTNFLAKCKGSAPKDFPQKFHDMRKDFKAENVSVYVVNVETDKSGTALVYANTISKLRNDAGNIIAETIKQDNVSSRIKFY